MTVKFKQTITSITVHHPDSSPIFGEQITRVSIDDDAGGWFIKLEQDTDMGGSQVIRIDPDEFEEISKAVSKLLKQAYS